MSVISNKILKYAFICMAAIWSGVGLCNELLRVKGMVQNIMQFAIGVANALWK